MFFKFGLNIMIWETSPGLLFLKPLTLNAFIFIKKSILVNGEQKLLGTPETHDQTNGESWNQMIKTNRDS